MSSRRRVDNDVFEPEILPDRHLLPFPFGDGAIQVQLGIDDLEHLVLAVLHDERTHSCRRNVEVINLVTFLVEIGLLQEKVLLEARADPGKEILVAHFSKEFELLKVLFVNFFTDFKSQMWR